MLVGVVVMQYILWFPDTTRRGRASCLNAVCLNVNANDELLFLNVQIRIPRIPQFRRGGGGGCFRRI